jgi:recombination endonuclease VII
MTTEEQKEKARWYSIKRLYGISQAEYEQILEEQDHRCGICKRHESEFEKRLSVDHDHKSLEIRGLLCHFCNSRFLGRHSNPDLFRAAAVYLEQPRRGWLTPKKKRSRKRRKKK